MKLGHQWFRSRAHIAAVIALLAVSVPLAGIAQTAAIPKSVQIDLLKSDILDDVKANKFPEALRKFDELRKLRSTLPPALSFLEAKVADKTGDSLRVVDALADYFNVAARDDKNYAEALNLMRRNEASASIASAAKAAEAEVKAEKERIAAEGKAAALKAAAMQRIPALLAEIEGAMKNIPAGEFRMGGDYEKPNHAVTVKRFKLSAYDVTFEQYDVFAQATGRSLPTDNGWGRGRRPVIDVSWDDAQAFAAWLSQQSGLKFRLPTEAEWEYAARAGTKTAYYWGNAFDRSKVAFAGNRTEEVGSHPANAFGLYDMSGNVWQWTQDCYNDSYAGAPSDGSAWISGDCEIRMTRGGSWAALGPMILTVWFRNMGEVGRDQGFRVAQDN
jgi:formylglycine-generating enzyme required for sulfatase activity